MERKVKMSGVKKTVKRMLGKDKKKYSVNDAANSAKEELKNESEETKRQRIKLFYTSGGASGQEVEDVYKKRKSLLGN